MRRLLAATLHLVVLTSALVLTSRPADAQQPDFSGAWTVDVAKTGIPGLPAYSVRIVQTRDTIEYTTSVPQPDGSTLVTTKTMPLDGREASCADARGRTLPCSASFSDAKLIVRHQSQQLRRGKPVLLEIEETHTLSADGRTLSIDHREGVGGQMGRYPNAIVLERAAAPGGSAAVQAPSGPRPASRPPAEAPPVRRKAITKNDSMGRARDDVEAAFRRLVEEGGAPSVSAALVVNGKIEWARNADGVAGLGTLYAIGSISKTFTAVAVLQLVERGLVALDADASRYLPFTLRHPGFPGRPITVRMLLAHQSGLVKDDLAFHRFATFHDADLVAFGAANGIALPHYAPLPSASRFYEGLVTPGGPYFTPEVWSGEPGTLQYSNIGFGLLTLVVERASGMPFETYVERHIFQPLGMTESTYSKTPFAPRHAPPMERLSGTRMNVLGTNLVVPDRMRREVHDGFLRLPLHDLPPGPVGVRTTVRDLARFLSAHMNGGLASNGHRLLRAETVDLMHRVATPARGSAIDIFPLEGQGLGWAVGTDGVGGHIGGQLGYTAAMIQKRTSAGSAGFIILLNMATRLDADASEKEKIEWWTTYYAALERALLDAAVEASGGPAKRPGAR